MGWENCGTMEKNRMYVLVNAKRRLKMNEIISLEVENLCKCFSFWDFEFNMEKRKRIENDIISGKRRMYVFEYAGKYIAGVCISTHNQDTCCISYLAVEENYQNKGIGTALIKFACDYAKDLNFKKVFLEVDYGNLLFSHGTAYDIEF